MPDDMQSMPQLGETSASMPDVTKLSFLSAEWINERIFNVTAKVDSYIDRIVDQGLLVDGYGPFEAPISDEVLERITPDQFRSLYDSEPSLEGKAALIRRVKALKLDIQELLPTEESLLAMMMPTAPLEMNPVNALSSSEAPV